MTQSRQLHVDNGKSKLRGAHTSMTLNYDLRHDQHAIGEFTATLQFKKSLTEDQFGPVQEKLREVATKYELPALAPLNILRVGSPPAGVGMPAPPISYQRFAKNGSVVAAIVCDDNTIAFTLREYTRWQDIEADLRDIFVELSESYLPAAESIRLLKLQYLNEFRAKTEAAVSAAELFRPKSKWLAPFTRESNDFWHCHIGSFLPGDANMRHLVNVNCDFLSAPFPPNQERRRYVKALVLAACYYDIGEPLALGGKALATKLAAGLGSAHALERRTLAELLSDPYLELMGALNDDY